jgi:hypothetical protein
MTKFERFVANVVAVVVYTVPVIFVATVIKVWFF